MIFILDYYVQTQAYAQSVNLSASDLYTPEETPTQYLNYGVAVSEVRLFMSSLIYQNWNIYINLSNFGVFNGVNIG